MGRGVVCPKDLCDALQACGWCVGRLSWLSCETVVSGRGHHPTQQTYWTCFWEGGLRKSWPFHKKWNTRWWFHFFWKFHTYPVGMESNSTCAYFSYGLKLTTNEKKKQKTHVPSWFDHLTKTPFQLRVFVQKSVQQLVSTTNPNDRNEGRDQGQRGGENGLNGWPMVVATVDRCEHSLTRPKRKRESVPTIHFQGIFVSFRERQISNSPFEIDESL